MEGLAEHANENLSYIRERIGINGDDDDGEYDGPISVDEVTGLILERYCIQPHHEAGGGADPRAADPCADHNQAEQPPHARHLAVRSGWREVDGGEVSG